MASIFPRYLKYVSIVIMIFAILYQCEIHSDSSDKQTLVLTKKSTLQYNRSYVYKTITNIDKYTMWYPNVARVEHIQSTSTRSQKPEGEKYRLITKLPIIGDVSSELIIHTKDQSKRFIYSVNSWVLEINSIELKGNSNSVNSTDIEWTVYTKRRSILFQYLLLPFAKFYKNQIVREALFSFMLQIRNL